MRYARYGITILIIITISLVAAISASAAVWTDQPDYEPGSAVTIFGGNNDGAGYLPGETVHVEVNGPNGYFSACDGIVSDAGMWSCQIVLNSDDSAVGAYSYTALGTLSGYSELGTFTDGPKPPPPPPTAQDVYWTGNGTNNGICNTIDTFDDLEPATGEQGWLFILTSPFNGDGSTLYATFSDGTDVVIGQFKGTGGGSYHYPVYTAAGATLLSAYATNGTQNSNLTVSHCEVNQQLFYDLTVSKTANPSYTRTFSWEIFKDVDTQQINTSGSATFDYNVTVVKDAGTDSNWQVNGTITVYNPNNFNVDVNLTDGACTLDSAALTVPALGNVSTGYSCTFSSNPISGTNVATASWVDFGSENTSASGSANFSFGEPMLLVNNEIDVTDTNGGSWHFTDSGSVEYPMTFNDPAGTCTYHDNAATITQTGASASKTVKVCVGKDLMVSKDATSAFTRTYGWDITKDVDKTLVKQIGGAATFNYTVHAWQTGFTDSNWAVNDTIHVVNPNDWEAITFDATDTLPGAFCTVTGGTGVNLAASSDTYLPYSCTFAEQPAYFTDLTNTATAAWDAALYYTPNGSASGTTNFQFTNPTTTVNKTITINDSYAGTLGTLTATDASPFAMADFTYSRTVPVPTWNCVAYDNTATIVETGQSDSETVRVCGPVKTGALTMGFWQNKNGQAIIGSYSGANCQTLRTWLNSFAPFSNLTATNCTGVKSYITNTIKSANASGASMNAMLKGQMLATALDVYFSDPALGGNRINAPTPIGGISIDLTMICTDMSCASFEDSSSVFGGTPNTVLEMLAYAASHSNPGGTMWYGNIKSTQELAKDAFDAINNEKVFAP